MLTEYFEVDEHGNILDVHLLGPEDRIPSNCFIGWGNRVVYSPIWDFETMDWKNGISDEEIENLTKPKPEVPSETSRIDALEFMMMELMMKQQMMDMEQPDLKL